MTYELEANKFTSTRSKVVIDTMKQTKYMLNNYQANDGIFVVISFERRDIFQSYLIIVGKAREEFIVKLIIDSIVVVT